MHTTTTTYTDTEATEALTAEGIPAEDIETYITQLTEVGLEHKDQPDTGLILTADELDSIRESARYHQGQLEKAQAQVREDLAGWDLLEVSEGDDGYDADDHGRLALQRNGEWRQFDATVGDAVAWLEDHLRPMVDGEWVEITIEAVPAYNDGDGRRWTFQIA